ncbi:MAG: ABC transporter permease [Candidatus Acetothermia bacterium]
MKTTLLNSLRKSKKLVIIYSVLAIIAVISAYLSPTFRSMGNISNLLHRAAPLLMISLGQTLAVLLTGLDLSVGPVASLTTVIAAVTMEAGPASILLGLFLVLAAGTGFGFVNGVGISKLMIHPLIATLSTMAVAEGLALLILPRPGGYIPYDFVQLLSAKLGPFSVPFLFFLLSAVLLYLLLHHTSFGRHLYAVGGDEQSARVSGLAVDWIKIKAFTLCGLFAAIGGLFLSVRIASGDPTAGSAYTLDSLTAVLMGGTTFAGGRGGIGGTIAGVFILLLLKNVFNFLGIHTYWQHVFKGLILVAAILAYNLQTDGS